MADVKSVLVTGGAGYVGSVLVPKLLQHGFHVKVVDLYIYGTDVLDAVKNHTGLEQIQGDIRDRTLLQRIIPGCDAVVHLACISNDPSFELNPSLGKTINYDAFLDLVDISKHSGVKRFIYASSSSVYGVKDDLNVSEDLPLEPLTDYSKYKALCEDVLVRAREPGFVTLILRPATVCGYSPRLRLDLSVNILTNHAVNNHRITVFGGNQKRPNIHIQDMTDLYVLTLQLPDEKIDGKIFNAGSENYTIMQIAEMVKHVVGEEVNIVTAPTNDHRSYHISSQRIADELGFIPRHSIRDAICDLVEAFDSGKIPNPMNDIRYYNIKTMQAINLK